MSEVAEVLRRAEFAVASRGHAKGDFIDENGRCCLFGSIRIAVAPDRPLSLNGGEFDTYYLALRVVEATLCDIAGEGYTDPVSWNDADDRTADEVRAALLTAAERAERAS